MPRIRGAVALAALSLIGFLFLGILSVSSDSSQSEIISKLATSAGVGIAIGVLVGLLSVFIPRSADDQPSPQNMAKAPQRLALILLAVIAVGIALLWFPRGRDDPKLADYGDFRGPQGQLEFGVITGPIDAQFGVVRITNDRSANSLVMEGNEWDRFRALLAKAEQTRSAQWSNVGEIRDTHPSDPALLQLQSGNGVRFVVSSPHGPTVAYDLPASSFERSNAAATAVANAKLDNNE
jgi:hypothetical protein